MTSVNIDGKAIRALREQKELTQLYLATVVGVTTDTISRWENRKYPSIKLENAEKLAEALGVELEDILEQSQEDSTESSSETGQQPSEGGVDQGDDQPLPAGRPWVKRFGPSVVFSAVALAIIVTGGILYFSGKEPMVTATRILPKHTAPGLSFPVIIRLEADQPINVPILLREVIVGNAVADGQKSGTERQHFEKNPRWIGRLIEGEAAFLYMVSPGEEAKQDETIRFSGDCVSGSLKKKGRSIDGPGQVAVTRYHWADEDQNHTITDEEILDAYERYSIPGGINMDFSEVEKLWLAGKYRWDDQQKKIIPE